MSKLKWATNKSANIKEPIEGLKDMGWQYGDVPTASNFNWLFRETFSELEKARAELAELKVIKQEIASTKALIEAFKKEQEKVISELKTSLEKAKFEFKASLEDIKSETKTLVNKKYLLLESWVNQICQHLYHHNDEHIKLGHKISFLVLPWAKDLKYKSSHISEK